MKFREFISSVIGILIRTFSTLLNIFIIISVYPFTIEYDDPKKLGLESSLKPFSSSSYGCSSSYVYIHPVPKYA